MDTKFPSTFLLTLFFQKEILNWKSKVQYKRNTPYVLFIKHLTNKYKLKKGNEIECRLVMENNKLKVVIDIG